MLGSALSFRIEESAISTEADAVDTLVIGAGVAGLTAAEELALAGQRVAVTEARDRVGGRTMTAQSASGVTVDLGGQWLGPTQHRAHGLVERFGLSTYPQFQSGRKILRRAAKTYDYRGTIPGLPAHSLVDLQLRMWALDRGARRLPDAAPWSGPDAPALDRQSVADWMHRHVWSQAARDVLRIAVHAVLAREPEAVSMLQFLSYIRSAGNLMSLIEVDGGAQQTRIAGGAQQLSERLTDRLRYAGGELHLASPVERIDWQADRAEVMTTTRQFTARHVVIAMAPGDARRIAFEPELPSQRQRAMACLPMGSVIKCLAIYDTPFWRHAGFSGEMVCTDGPLRMTFDATPDAGGCAMLVGFILGDAAQTWSRAGADTRRDAVSRQLASLFGPAAGRPVDYIDHDWCADEWTGGCYVGLFEPGADMPALAPALRERIGPLHWAGTETATRWAGYIDGAIESGQRAATDILAA